MAASGAKRSFGEAVRSEKCAKGRFRFPMVILQYRGPNYGCNAFPPW